MIHQQPLSCSRAGTHPCPALCLEAITDLSLTLISLNPLASGHQPSSTWQALFFEAPSQLSSSGTETNMHLHLPIHATGKRVVLRGTDFNIKITLYKNTFGV